MPSVRIQQFIATNRDLVKNLSPSYFAMVMATGIVSIASFFQGMSLVAYILFYFNAIVYIIIWVATLLRLRFYFENIKADMLEHARAPGFWTSVAGTCVLGSQFILLRNDFFTATVLWILGIILWLFITYAIFTSFTIKENKPTLAEGINGAWLLAVVSTQSLAVLSAKLSMHFDDYKLIINFWDVSRSLKSS